MQFTASRNLEHVCRVRLLDMHRNIRLDLLEEAVANVTRGDKLPLTSRKRARIDTERHRECRLIDVDRRQCLRILCICHRIADAHIAEPRQGDDLAHPRLVHIDAPQALIDIDFADFRLGVMVAADDDNILIRTH